MLEYQQVAVLYERPMTRMPQMLLSAPAVGVPTAPEQETMLLYSRELYVLSITAASLGFRSPSIRHCMIMIVKRLDRLTLTRSSLIEPMLLPLGWRPLTVSKIAFRLDGHR